MRLRQPSDRTLLLSELGLPYNSEVEVTDEHYCQIIEKRPDWRKSKDQKARWRRNRNAMMRGIKKFHKSTAGKKFHRQLARYAATRLGRSNNKLSESVIESNVDDFLTAVSSLRTHMYIDLGYYKPLIESIEYSELLEYVIPILNEVELKFISRRYSELTAEELDVLLNLVSTDVFEEIFAVKVDEDLLFTEENYLATLMLGT